MLPNRFWQPNSNLVYFSFKICHLVAGFAVSLHSMQLTSIGRAKCIVCPTNVTVGRVTALHAHYIPTPV